jgi:hypothetical protein
MNGTAVVRESRLRRDGLFGALLAVFVLAFARGFPNAQTTAGRVAVTVFTGAVAAVLVVAWIRLIRRAARLEITSDAITLIRPRTTSRTLSGHPGDRLSVVIVGGTRYRNRGLTIAGSGTVLPLPFFSLAEVRRACLAAGWQFGAS